MIRRREIKPLSDVVELDAWFTLRRNDLRHYLVIGIDLGSPEGDRSVTRFWCNDPVNIELDIPHGIRYWFGVKPYRKGWWRRIKSFFGKKEASP